LTLVTDTDLIPVVFIGHGLPMKVPEVSRSVAGLDFVLEGAMLKSMVCLLLSIDRRVAHGCAPRPDGESAPQG
jgi:hypothetical protein